MRPPLVDEPPPSITRLGDWYANLVRIAGKDLVLAVSAPTLLPVVMPAAPIATVVDRLPTSVAELLDALRVAPRDIDAEIGAMNDVSFGTTTNPHVLGVLVDNARLLSLVMDRPVSLRRAALNLARVPCRPLPTRTDTPAAATLAVFGGPRLRVVR